MNTTSYLDYPIRPVKLGGHKVDVREEGGTFYIHPKETLKPYPEVLSQRLYENAEKYPDRVFVARRGADGQWRKYTYAQTLQAVRNIAQALMPYQLSAERPLMILSENSIETFLLNFGAMVAGMPHAYVAPAYSLVANQNFSREEINYVQIGFNVGGVIGTLVLGLFLDKLNIKAVVMLIYAGMLAALYALSSGSELGSIIAATLACGMFIIGGQGTLYALAGMFYPAAIRGTGVGTAVAVGRAGSFAGPILAGLILGAGQSSSAVISAAIPVIGVAFVSAFVLVLRFKKTQDTKA